MFSWYGSSHATTASSDQPASTRGRGDRTAHARFTVLSPKIPVGRIITSTVNTTNVTRSE